MIQDLKNKIEQYLAGGKNRSLGSLATKSGVSYSTITRISQGKGSAVEMSNVLAILKIVATPEDGAAFLKEYFPGVGAYFAAMAKASARPAEWTVEVSPELANALCDFESFCIVSLASTPKGASREQILATVGRHGIEKLEALLAGEVLELVDGRYISTQRDFSPTNNAILSAEIRHMLNLIRPSNVGRQRQHCAVRTNGLTREGQQKLHACLQKALIEADQIITENPGDIPVFLGAVMGMFEAARDDQ